MSDGNGRMLLSLPYEMFQELKEEKISDPRHPED
jgi:hypothetical protein